MDTRGFDGSENSNIFFYCPPDQAVKLIVPQGHSLKWER